MNVKEKVGVLGLRPTSAGYPESHGDAGSAPRHAAAAGFAATPSAGGAASSGTKSERQAAALQLWNRWAQEALGPLSSEPTAQELARKSSRVVRLEKECAAMAARAQRRLEVSSAIRAQGIVIGASRGGSGGGSGASGSAGAGGGAGSGVGLGVEAGDSSCGVGGGASEGGGGGGGGGSAGVLLRPGSFSRDMQYAVRERRRAAAYATVRAEGAAEATAQAAADAAAAAAAEAAAGIGQSALKSRAMLDALIAGRAVGAAGGAAAPAAPAALLAAGNGGGSSLSSPKSGGGSRLRPHSALPLRSSNGGGSVTAAGRLRPRSAVPGSGVASLGRQASLALASGGPVIGGGGGAFARAGSMVQRAASLAGASAVTTAAAAAGLVALPEGEYRALRQEMESVSARLASTQAALEVQTDTEAQLREAVDLLRARLHSAGLREVDAQRRLAQHAKLEPLFDRLAECFTFSSPEEVVARLEFLEDDKLGTFDQLLRTQEEVTRLQQRLAEAQKAGDMAATRLTTEHLQGSARLQEQNEELRQELESMEALVNRLTARQAQLVALQTAVLQLWGKLSEDPQFAEAFVSGTASSPAAPRGRSAGRTPPWGSGSLSLSTHGGADEPAAAASPAGSGIQSEDPLSMLHMIEEFVTAKSNKLSIRHFTDIQRIANHVWQQHFRNRADIRGRVVPTFESLSKMADRMAGRVKAVGEQAGRSQDAEKTLMREVRRLQQQKRALEVALARRDEQFKNIMGVPRRDRPASAAAELGRIMRREATASYNNPTGSGAAAGGGGGGAGSPGSRALSTLSLSPSGPGRGSGRGADFPLDTSFSIVSGLSSAQTVQLRQPQLRPHTAAAGTAAVAAAASQPQPLQLQPHSKRPLRPVSAPNSTAGGGAGAITAGSVVSGASRLRLGSAATGAAAPPPSACSAAGVVAGGGTLAAVLSPAVALQVPQMVSDLPAGAHWRQHTGPGPAAAAQRTAPLRLPAGSLFYTADRAAAAPAGATGGTGAAAAAPSAPAPVVEAEVAPLAAAEVEAEAEAEGGGGPTARWSAPQRSAIELAFLSRLERRARVA